MLLFLQSLQKVEIITPKVVLGFLLLVIQQVSILCLIFMDGNPETRRFFWLFADLSFDC